MKNLVFFILFMSLCFKLSAGQISYTYLGKGTAPTLALSKSGYSYHTQPPMITRVIPSPNTNYYLIQVSTASSIDNVLISFLESTGKIYKVYYTELVEYIDSDGKFKKDVVRKTYIDMPTVLNPLPTDFNRDWTFVEKSTP